MTSLKPKSDKSDTPGWWMVTLGPVHSLSLENKACGISMGSICGKDRNDSPVDNTHVVSIGIGGRDAIAEGIMDAEQIILYVDCKLLSVSDCLFSSMIRSGIVDAIRQLHCRGGNTYHRSRKHSHQYNTHP